MDDSFSVGYWLCRELPITNGDIFLHDTSIQNIIDTICWEDNEHNLYRTADFFAFDQVSKDDLFSLGAAFGQYVEKHYCGLPVWEFNIGNGKVYFIGTRIEVQNRVEALN